MILTITQNDLLRFVYKETSLDENVAILKALENDTELQEELNDFEYLRTEISKVRLTPPTRMTEKLLFFSANFNSKA